MGVIEPIESDYIVDITETFSLKLTDAVKIGTVRELEKQRDEMLEALIEVMKYIEITWLDNENNFSLGESKDDVLKECHNMNKKTISAIESATGKTWKQVKDATS